MKASMLAVRLTLRDGDDTGMQECPCGSTEFVREVSGTFAELTRGSIFFEDFAQAEVIASTQYGCDYVYRCVKCLRQVLPWAP